MIHMEGLKRINELQDFFEKDGEVSEIIVDIFNKFKVCKTAQRLNEYKQKGFPAVEVFLVLVLSPFFSVSSVRALYKSGLKALNTMQKDTFYRLKNNSKIDWRQNLYSFAKRFTKIVASNSNTTEDRSGVKCLIVDDSLLSKVGEKIEFLGRVYDHVTNRYVLGFKQLLLGFWDGKSFIPLDFSFHSEKGKNKKRPYGMKLSKLKKRYSKKRDRGTPGFTRTMELSLSKIDNAINMIKRAVKHGFTADYVLVDKWFISEKFILSIRKIRKGAIHILAACKMDKRKYVYNGKEHTAKEILKNSKKTNKKRSRKLRAFYIEVAVEYKGIPMKLFFNRFSGQRNWQLLETTDVNLNFARAVEIYSIRWSIEVFFKENKQYLNLGKCQSNDFDAQIADTTISLTQYIILSLYKRFSSYETIGSLFYKSKEKFLELTVAGRLWGLFLEILQKITKTLGVDVNEIMTKIFNLPNFEEKILTILRAFDDKETLPEIS